jgi:hypothetical protein
MIEARGFTVRAATLVPCTDSGSERLRALPSAGGLREGRPR